MIILDTNVVSEFMHPRPDPAVLSWLDGIPRGEIWTTSITLAGLAAGIAVLPNGKRRGRLESGFDRALRGFGDRIHGFTAVTAAHYGAVVGKRVRIGRPISIADAQIAAITTQNRATLATRNTKDFQGTGIVVFNPWDAATAAP